MNESIHNQEGQIKYLTAPLSMTQFALTYVKNGLSVIPIGDNKQPAIRSWKTFQKTPAQISELLKWWPTPDLSMAIICGEGSKNLEGIDFDKKYNTDPDRLYDQWRKLVDAEKPGLVNKLVTQKTLNDGEHCLYRCKVIEGNQKLAQRLSNEDELKKEPKAKSKTLIETRGTGGYLLCYPSPGYGLCNGSLTEIPEITPEEREILLSCARALNQLVEKEKVVRDKSSKSNGNRPGDVYDREGDHKALLEKNGWTYVGLVNEREYWRRPGKTEGISATFNVEDRVLYNFSSNSPGLEPDRYYTMFSLFTNLEAGGDYSQAAKKLLEQGFGEDVSILIVEKYMRERYDFRLNRIKDKLEFRVKDSGGFTDLRDVELNSIYMELVRAKKDIGFDEFCRLLYSDFTEEYDPVIKYFEGLKKWDGSTDYIKELSETITLKDSKQEQQWQKCLRRWLIGYVACAVNSDTVNQTAIILVGLQGIGKSRWLNRLVPEELAKYRFEGTINPDNKDTLIFLSECMLINLDELETLRKSEIGALKTLMTMQAVKVRRPYGRLAEDLARRASFVGSINQTEFLNDATGSRRFLVFETNKVDIDKLPDINNVLAQAYELYKQGERWWFDTAEIAKINMHNKEYAVATSELANTFETNIFMS